MTSRQIDLQSIAIVHSATLPLSFINFTFIYYNTNIYLIIKFKFFLTLIKLKNMLYYELIDSGSKMLKTDKSYLQEEKQLFKSKDVLIYGIKDLYSNSQLYVISIVVLVLILMFPFKYDNLPEIYSV